MEKGLQTGSNRAYEKGQALEPAPALGGFAALSQLSVLVALQLVSLAFLGRQVRSLPVPASMMRRV